MSAPSYDSSSYDAAADKYRELQDKYTGEAGWDLSTRQAESNASKQSLQAGQNAGATAQGAARSAGMSRSKAIATGAQASGATTAAAYNNAYNTNLSASLQNNANTMNAQSKLMDTERQKATDEYNSDVNKYSAGMGAIGGIFSGLGGSDKDIKDIKKQSSSERCDELLKRLKGDK